MKKVLSIILVIAMLIVPVGAVSCFADGGRDASPVFDTMREWKVSRTTAIIILMQDGECFAELSLFGEDGSYLGTREASEHSYRVVGTTLIELGIQEAIRSLGCSRAHIICDNDIGGFYSITINFYDSEGMIVKTLKKDGYIREVELGS